MEQEHKIVKLYEIPRESKIKVPEGTVTFHKIDGMYSYCTVDWVKEPDNVTHLGASTPLRVMDGYYELV